MVRRIFDTNGIPYNTSNSSTMILTPLGRHVCILNSKPTKWRISHGLLRLLCFSVFHPRAAHFQQCDFLISLINFFDIYCVYSDFSVLCINQLIPVSLSSLVFVYWFWLGRRRPRGGILSVLFSNSKRKRIVSNEVVGLRQRQAASQHVVMDSILHLMVTNFR